MSYRERRNRKDGKAKTPWQVRKAFARSQGNHLVFAEGKFAEHPGRRTVCDRGGHG